MSLTKLEPPNLDLPIWSYEIYKTAQKLEFLNYPYELQPLPCGTRVSADPTGQRQQNRGGARDGAAHGEASRRRLLRRIQRHRRAPQGLPRRLMLLL